MNHEKMMAATLLGPIEQLENKQGTGWEWMRHRNRWWETRRRCRVKPTSDFAAERRKQTHVPSTYLHRSYQRRRGCNILPQLHLSLPGSTNSRCGLLCISAYSLSTWPASGEGKETRDMGEINVSAGEKYNSTRGFESLCSGSCSSGTVRQAEMAGRVWGNRLWRSCLWIIMW